jgi:membrane-associated phospholipid phosphatase
MPTKPWPRRLLILAALLLVDYTLGAALARTPREAWPAWRVTYVAWATHAGYGATTLLMAALLAAAGCLFERRAWRLGARWLAGSTLLAGFWVHVIKHLVGRPRPRMLAWHGAWLPVGPTLRASWDSCPSGHAMTVFAAAPVLAALWPKTARLWYSLAVLVAVGRAVGGDHYPSDVVIGGILGLTIGRYCAARWRDEVEDEGVPVPR